MCIIKIKNPPLDAFPANSVAGFINVKVIIFGWGLRNEPNEYLREVGYILILFNIILIIRQTKNILLFLGVCGKTLLLEDRYYKFFRIPPKTEEKGSRKSYNLRYVINRDRLGNKNFYR